MGVPQDFPRVPFASHGRNCDEIIEAAFIQSGCEHIIHEKFHHTVVPSCNLTGRHNGVACLFDLMMTNGTSGV
jgi:hypothetical protein